MTEHIATDAEIAEIERLANEAQQEHPGAWSFTDGDHSVRILDGGEHEKQILKAPKSGKCEACGAFLFAAYYPPPATLRYMVRMSPDDALALIARIRVMQETTKAHLEIIEELRNKVPLEER